MRRIIFFIALFIPTLQIHARESEQVISGRVVDERNGAGIPGVTIYTSDGRSCTGSNEDGKRHLIKSQPDTHNMMPLSGRESVIRLSPKV